MSFLGYFFSQPRYRSSSPMLAASLKEVYKNTNTPTYHLRTVLAFYKNIKGFTVYGNKMSSSRKKKKKKMNAGRACAGRLRGARDSLPLSHADENVAERRPSERALTIVLHQRHFQSCRRRTLPQVLSQTAHLALTGKFPSSHWWGMATCAAGTGESN